jgi:hypothetical protein
VLAACVTRSRNDERGPQEVLTRILYACLPAGAPPGASSTPPVQRRPERGVAQQEKLWRKPWPVARRRRLRSSISPVRICHDVRHALTGVYEPLGDEEKQVFLQELKQIKQFMNPRWLLLRDFNLIYRSCDKNNGRVDRRLMTSFRSTVNELEIKEIHMHGRKFTWSSGSVDLTMKKINHIFATRDWEMTYPHCHL